MSRLRTETGAGDTRPAPPQANQRPCVGPVASTQGSLTVGGHARPEPPLLGQLCLDSRQGSNNAKREEA